MRSLFNRASLINGVIAGVLIFAIKFILYMTGNWQMRFDPVFAYGSFAIMVGAMFLGSRGDRKHMASYGYWQAMLSCMITIASCVIISGIADQTLYLMNKDLAEQTLANMKQTTYEKIQKAPAGFRAQAEKRIDEMTVHDIKGIAPYAMQVGAQILANGIMAFAVAAFLYRRKAKFDYSEEITDDQL